MGKRGTLEERLARLEAMRGETVTAEIARELTAALGDTSNLVAARAAEVMGASGHEEFLMPLISTFERLLGLPATADKMCRAKEAIIHALEGLELRDATPYAHGCRYVQMEPVFGGKADTASILRSDCALALARLGDIDAHFSLTTLLTDPEPQPRQAAVRALAHLGDEKSELLLRLKVLTGDSDPSVIQACFTGLLAMDAERSLPFVAEFLDERRPEIAESAAMALGESRLEEAFPLLRHCYEESVDLQFARTLLLPMALTRNDGAIDYLLTVIDDGGRSAAVVAVTALAIYAADARIRPRVRAAVRSRKDDTVAEAYREGFGQLAEDDVE